MHINLQVPFFPKYISVTLPRMKIVDIIGNVEPDEKAHNELPQ